MFEKIHIFRYIFRVFITEFTIRIPHSKYFEFFAISKRYGNMSKYYVKSKTYGAFLLLFYALMSNKTKTLACKWFCKQLQKPIEPYSCEFKKMSDKVRKIKWEAV